MDIEEETLGMDPALVPDAAGPRTRGLLPVHVYGNRCAIGELSEIARDRRWLLIEDACEAVGTTRRRPALGSLRRRLGLCLLPNKQITTGEGGMVLTDDPELADVMRSLRNQGRDKDGTWLRHVRLGFNYRLDELSAALGVAQMRRRAELAAGRGRVARRYQEGLQDVEGLILPRAPQGTDVDWFVFVVRLAAGLDRDRIMQDLATDGVPTRPYFSPIHLQPLYRNEFGYGEGDFPVTERVAASTMALPFSSRLADDDVDYVVERLAHAIHGR